MESVGKRKRPAIKVEFVKKNPKKKPREYAQEYRDRIKSDPEFYKLHRQSETHRIKKYRAERQSEEAKQRNRELQKLRQQKYRERQKEIGIKTLSKPKTRHTQEIQRQKWREDKQKQRLRMSTQKRTAINTKRKEKTKKAKTQSSVSAPSIITTKSVTEISTPTTSAFRTAKSRQKKKISVCVSAMPNNPNLKAAAIEATINEQSPRTKKCINDKLGVQSPSTKAKRRLAIDALCSVKETLEKLKSKRSKQDIRTRRVIAHALKLKGKAVMKSAGISRKLCKRLDCIKTGWEDTEKGVKMLFQTENRRKLKTSM